MHAHRGDSAAYTTDHLRVYSNFQHDKGRGSAMFEWLPSSWRWRRCRRRVAGQAILHRICYCVSLMASVGMTRMKVAGDEAAHTLAGAMGGRFNMPAFGVALGVEGRSWRNSCTVDNDKCEWHGDL